MLRRGASAWGRRGLLGILTTSGARAEVATQQRLSASDSSASPGAAGLEKASSSSWNDEWREVGLGANKGDGRRDKLTRLMFTAAVLVHVAPLLTVNSAVNIDPPEDQGVWFPGVLLCKVQAGFGNDQHGNRDGEGATQAAIRACRNAIEFNSIPGMIEAVPGGRKNMLIHVKLGVPVGFEVDLDKVAMVFPYGRLLPLEVVPGGITYGCGRVVPELGDQDDTAIIVCAVVSIGYYDPASGSAGDGHRVWDTRDGH